MTPLQKSILAAVKRRPMTLRELQNNLQVDNLPPAPAFPPWSPPASWR